MLSENLRSVIRKLVDGESFNDANTHYRTAVKVVENRLDEYHKLKPGAERMIWLQEIVFDVCHRGLSHKKYVSKEKKQVKKFARQIQESKNLLRALKHFIN